MSADSGDVQAFNERTARPLGQAMSLNGDPAALREYYAAWASDYDRDVGGDEYGLPGSVLFTIQAASEHEPWLNDPNITILDAGCGTGRIGLTLAQQGYTTIDGVDLAPEMVALAKARGVYRELEAPVDLMAAPSNRWAQSADLVVVGGVFTVGHIPPESLLSVAKLVRPGGVLVTTVRPGYFDSTDYGAVSQTFADGPDADLLVHFPALPYTEDTDGRYYAYRINGRLSE